MVPLYRDNGYKQHEASYQTIYSISSPQVSSGLLSTLRSHVPLDSIDTHCLVDNADGFTIDDLIFKSIAFEF